MAWRYQPVWKDYPITGRVYSLCEVYFDKDGKLESWTENPAMTPSGNDIADLQGTLERMLSDTRRWEPVDFDSLVPGMAITRKEVA